MKLFKALGDIVLSEHDKSDAAHVEMGNPPGGNKVVPPSPNIPDDVDEQRFEYIPHKGPFSYFANIGFVMYERTCVLMGRQVVKFADLSRMWYRRDARFVRLTVKMEASGLHELGHVAMDNHNIPAIGNFAELDGTSYKAWLAADSVAGFTGRCYVKSKGSLLASDVRNLMKRVRQASLVIREGPASSDRALWPSFYLKAGHEMPGAVEMFDLDSGKWIWLIELKHLSPITVGFPGAVSSQDIEELEARLFQAFQFTGVIYIGLLNIKPVQQMRLDGYPTPPEYPAWYKERIQGIELHPKMEQHDLWFDAWAFPCPRKRDTTLEYEARVLNAWVQRKTNQMLGTN